MFECSSCDRCSLSLVLHEFFSNNHLFIFIFILNAFQPIHSHWEMEHNSLKTQLRGNQNKEFILSWIFFCSIRFARNSFRPPPPTCPTFDKALRIMPRDIFPIYDCSSSSSSLLFICTETTSPSRECERIKISSLLKFRLRLMPPD